jgi:hypothetical protein
VNGVLLLVLVTTDPRSDSLPGGVSHNIAARCSEGWPLVPSGDPVPEEDLYDGLQFHPHWTGDFFDPVSRGGGDAQVYQQGLKPAGGDRSFNPKGLDLVSISVRLLDLCVSQDRVLLIIIVFIVDVMVLQLLLLSGCALGCWALRYHQLDHKRLLLLRYVLWGVVLWVLRLWHIPRCQLTNELSTGALAYGATCMSHLSFRKRSVR